MEDHGISISTVNGLAPNSQHAITWTNVDLDVCCQKATII